MAFSFLVNKLQQKRQMLSLVQHDIEFEKRQERRSILLNDGLLPTVVDPDACLGTVPMYFTRLQRSCLKISWHSLTNYKNRRRTMLMLMQVFNRLQSELDRRCLVHSSETSCHNHARYMYEYIDAFVSGKLQGPLSNGYRLPSLHNIARHHLYLSPHGFTPNLFELFGVYLIDEFLLHETIYSYTCIRANVHSLPRNGKNAWLLFFATMIDELHAKYTALLAWEERTRSIQSEYTMKRSGSSSQEPDDEVDSDSAEAHLVVTRSPVVMPHQVRRIRLMRTYTYDEEYQCAELLASSHRGRVDATAVQPDDAVVVRRTQVRRSASYPLSSARLTTALTLHIALI